MRKISALAILAAASSIAAAGGFMAYESADARSKMPAASSAALAAAVSGTNRSEANKARDQYRNPAETLNFFGIKPEHTVVELWPGGGWYTEILAPYLQAKGKLIVAPPMRGTENVNKFLAKDAAVYGKVSVANFPIMMGGTAVAPNSVDAVLTFRNVHNWRMGSGKEDKSDYSAEAFKEIYAMLKPGGVLGIEDHRLNEDADAAKERDSGYIKTSTVCKLAEDAGLMFVGASEINANPKDTKDYPKGVWTLPPRFAEGDTDKAKYAAIGESDRMTLKFMKPNATQQKGKPELSAWNCKKNKKV
jgi:predicted methyltransferase